MPNIYTLWIGGTPPGPWQKKSDWNGRYVRFSSNLTLHGYTDGASSHNHTTSGYGCGGVSESYCPNCSYVVSVMRSHTHPFAGSSVSSISNDPTYRTLELIYMDYTSWETNERRFPAGVVLVSETALSLDELSRYSAADNRLIKIDTAGSNGGSDNHSGHSVSWNMGEGSHGASLMSGYDIPSIPQTGHTHSSSASSASRTSLPYRIRTRLYQTTQLTTKAQVGTICFFDGTPTGNWVPIDWNTAFLMGADENANATGSNTHTGETFSVSSSSYGWMEYHTGYYDSGEAWWINAFYHSHTTNLTIDAADHTPLYVNLVPFKLNTTLYYLALRSASVITC